MPNRSGRPQTMFPSFATFQGQQLGQNLNLGQEYTPETAAKMQALERRQQLANILLQQGMQPKEARQAGRFVVAPSLWEQASGPLTTAMGALSSLYLDDQRSALASDEAKRVAAAYQAYNEGTSDDPGYQGRRIPGTGTQGVEAQPAVVEPSNLESIIAAEQVQARPDVMRKSVSDVTNAMAQRQRPPMLRSNPQWDGPAAIPTPYRPAVETKPAVVGVPAAPDRRESPYEALEREFGAQAAQDFVKNGFAPGTTPETAARMERVVKDAERPDTPGRPRTPGELMAADTALLASGAPGAWPLIQLTKQQREMDLARKESGTRWTAEMEQKKEFHMADAAARIEEARATRAMTAAQTEQAEKHFQLTFGQTIAQFRESQAQHRKEDERARVAEVNRNAERNEPSSAQMKEYEALGTMVSSSTALLGVMRDMLAPNADGISPNDLAYSGGLESIIKQIGSVAAPNNPRVMATQQLQSVFDKKALANLKASFGGQPSDKEGNWLRQAEGMMEMAPALRRTFLEAGIQLLEDKIARDTESMAALQERRYPHYAPPRPSSLSKPAWETFRPGQEVPPTVGPAPAPTPGFGFRPLQQQ